MLESTLSESDLARVIDLFYDRVRDDAALGPIFNSVVHDWPEHKSTLVSFWSAIDLKTARYRGNPMAVHRALTAQAADFDQWLTLWARTTDELLAPADAARLQQIANRIAKSLMHGMGIPGLRPPVEALA